VLLDTILIMLREKYRLRIFNQPASSSLLQTGPILKHLKRFSSLRVGSVYFTTYMFQQEQQNEAILSCSCRVK